MKIKHDSFLFTLHREMHIFLSVPVGLSTPNRRSEVLNDLMSLVSISLSLQIIQRPTFFPTMVIRNFYL